MERISLTDYGRFVELCAGPEKDRWLPGHFVVDNNLSNDELTADEIERSRCEDLREGYPFKDNSVDQISCRYGWRYLWRDTEELLFQLKEVARVLVPGGRIIIQEYCRMFNNEWEEIDVTYDTVWRHLALAVMALNLEGIQLSVEADATTKGFSEEDCIEYVWILQKPMEVK